MPYAEQYRDNGVRGPVDISELIQTRVEDDDAPLELRFDVPKKLAELLIPEKLTQAVAKRSGTVDIRLGENNSEQFAEFLFVDEQGHDFGSFVFDESKDTRGLIAEDEVATALLYAQFSRLNNFPEVLVLNTLDLAEALQGNGIGGEFDVRMSAMAQALQFEAIVGDAENEKALRFYLANGFEILDEDDDELEAMERQGLFDGEDGHTPVIKRFA